MIHHLSIAARDPQHVAGVLAELMGGKAVRPIRVAFSRSSSTSTDRGSRSIRPGRNCSRAAPMAGALSRKKRAAMERRISRSASRPTRTRSRPLRRERAGNAFAATAARSM